MFAGLVWFGLGSTAFAQALPQVDAQLYRVPVDAGRTLWADDSEAAPNGYWRTKLGFNYARDPLVYRYEDGREVRILGTAAEANLISAISYAGIRLGLDVPIWLAADGDLETGGAGLGDLAIDLKGTLLDRSDAPFGLALGGRFSLPTATVLAPIGSPGLGWALQVILDKEFDRLLLTANAGTQGIPPANLAGVQWDDQFFYRFGAGLALDDDAVNGVSGDLAGRVAYGGLGVQGAPLEALVGGWHRFGSDWVLRGGVGSGLTSGVGAPDLRFVATFGYEPPLVRDSDEDGILDKVDQCRDEPEDMDGWLDADGCPDPTTSVLVSVQNAKIEAVPETKTIVGTHAGDQEGGADVSVELHPGTWPVRVSAPRYAPLEQNITVPEGDTYQVVITLDALFGEVRVMVTDLEGKPVDASARSSDGALHDARGGATQFEVDAGPQSVLVQASGYQPRRVPVTVVAGEVTDVSLKMTPARAKVTKEKIEILDKVFFDTGKATIKPASFPLLDDVAALLDANPDIKRIRVEGHTDSRGNARSNLSLSQQRAESVQQYLVGKGVAADRLEAVGYGEEKPIDPTASEAAFEQNRRVEFNILTRE